MFKRKEYKEKQLRYSIRKVSFGAASVAISALYLLMGSAAVSASEVQAVNGDQTTVTNPTVKDNEDKSRIEKHETTTEAANSAVVTLDKTSLTKLIEEIDGKFTSGKYASKTEDSVNKLKAALEEARTALSNAKTQAELSQAYANLIVATTKLQTKPEEKKEAPAVDTTNGKATVGKKATNTEKASDSNSIANSGSRDERNGKALDTNNPFRTDAATTDTDPAANQTYTAPAENADLGEITKELLKLPDAVQNNTKIQDMNDLGDKTGVARGDVKEIQEFGGWKAINQPDGTPGKFAIARKTESGIFPVETVNTVYTNINRGRAEYYDTYVGEQAFDRSKDYMLFLGKVRTIASETEQTFNGQPYKRSGLGGSDSFAIKSFNGIEKTFKAHSPATGSKVKVAFKTGFTGDLNGTKANYLVEVVYRQNNSEVTAYTYSFEPQPRKTLTNEKGIVTPAKDGTGRAFVRSDFNNYTLNKAEVEAKMAEAAYKPNGQAGTFTSSDIDLPVGVTEYTVRIKVTNTERMGMGYQSPLRHYALPVTGLDFSIEQDTRKLAKNLLQRVYDKLKATEERDIKGKTEATINAYKTQLENVKNLLDGELSSTRTYKDIVTAVLADQQALRTDKSKLTASNNNLLGLINEDPDPRIGKTPVSKEPYNTAKDEAVKAQTEAQTILAQENPDPDVVAAAVSKLNEKLAELKAARAELVVAATEVQKTKLAADKAKLVEASKEGKTQDSINAYESRYNALKSDLDAAVAAANDVANAQENASKVSALEAQEKVTEVLAKLEEAKALLKDKATDAQIAELKKAEKALTPISDNNLGNKKPTSVQNYKNAVAGIQSELTEAQTKVAELLEKAKTDNAAKEEAAQLISKVDALKSKLTDAATLLEDKANTGGLETAKNELKQEAAEEVTAGKTPETVTPYTAAKQAADEAVTEAEGIIANPNATQEAVNTALQKVAEKKAALAAAKKALVEAATPEQKAALAKDAEGLVEASKEGKTPESITAYEAKLQELNNELTAAKEAAKAIAAKGENASKDAAIEAQAKVSAIKAKLADAATLLKDKANTSALETAKNELKEAVAEEVTAGKTPETVGSYNTAKQAADEAVKAAEAVLSNPNATQDAVNTALQTVTEKKAALATAKKALVEAATPEQKTTLATDAAALVPASKEGKTPESITAYEARLQELNGELTAAKQAAEAIAAKGENASKDAAIEAQAKVSAIKAKLADAATLLKDKANTSALETAKNELKEAVAEEVTAGKTPETVGSYNTAKQVADEAVKAAEAVLSNPNATQDAVNAALQTVTEKKAALAAAKKALVDKITQDQKDDLANAEENLKLADTTGKTKDSIKAYNDEVAKLSDELAAAKQAAKAIVDKGDNAGELEAYRVQAKINKLKSKLAEAAKLLKEIDKSAAKKEVEDAAKKATDAIVANNDLTSEQKEAVKAKVAEKATKAIAAIEKATTEDDVTTAKESGKLGIEKEAAKAEIEAAKAAKEKAIEANTDLTPEQKAAAKAKVAEEATKATAAIDQATTKEAVTTATDAGKLGIEKEAAKAEIEAAKAAKEKAIEANTDLTPEQKAAAKAKVAEEATKATAAIDQATTKDGVTTATDAGKLGIEKEAAKAEIEAAKAAKEKAIDANDKLSDSEKQAAKEEAARVADEAKKAIDVATDSAGVDGAKTTGTTAVDAVNPVGKEKALDAIQKATEDKLAEIDRDDKSSDKEKDKAKAEVAKAAIEAVNAINAATDQASVDTKQAEGTKAVSEVNPVGKDKAKAEIEKSLSEKTNAIDANSDLTDEQKAEAKAKIADEAKKAIDAIDKATTTEDVAAAKESGKLAIEKEAAKAEIEAAKAAKDKAIDANPDLTDAEKATAKDRVEEEAEAAKNAIDKATELSDIDKVTETGKDDIKKVTVTSAKEEAKKAIDEALAAKEKAIDARTDLIEEEKEAAKKAAREEAEAAKNAIDKATTLEDINKVLEDGKENIAKINPENLKDKAKKAIDEALAAKEKAIDARTDLTEEEKEAAKKAAREEAEAAKNAIDKATTLEDINKVLEDGKENIAKINPLGAKEGALAFEGSLQASVTGVVQVELGKAITQADIIAKLNLPETVTVMNIELPDTTTLGRKFAKVTLRLADGKETTVFVPVEVVESSKEDKQQNNTQEDSKPTVVPSNNSEQPTVTQTEDVKENPSNTSQESKGSNQKVLPNTGTGNEISIFGSAAMTVLASLGLVATSKKKEEE